MTAGLIDFSKRGDDEQPSPSVWAGCPRTLLSDHGYGLYVHRDFAAEVTLPGLLDAGTGTQTWAYNDANGDTVVRAGTGSEDNDSVLAFTRPLGRVIRNSHSNTKLWFETRVALVQINDQAAFFGLVEGDGVAGGDDLIADDPSNSAQAGLEDVSLIGFVTQQADSESTKLDAVYRNDDGDVVTVAADVTNSSALAQKTANGQVQPDLRGDLAANEFRKLGVVYNSNLSRIEWFVDGVRVATADVDESVDQDEAYAGVVALHNGTAAARSLDIDFFRAAAQHRT